MNAKLSYLLVRRRHFLVALHGFLTPNAFRMTTWTHLKWLVARLAAFGTAILIVYLDNTSARLASTGN